MEELIQNYSVGQIVLFIFVLMSAVKAFWTLVEFFTEKIKNRFSKEQKKEDHDKEVKNQLEECNEKLDFLTDSLQSFSGNCEARFEKIEGRLDLLSNSDRDDIKSFIVREYHYFVEQKGWVDDFSLDVLEKRYSHYKEEGGNSYISNLMERIRQLPHSPIKK